MSLWSNSRWPLFLPKDWFHREIKPHLTGDNPEIGKEGHDEYERQWSELGCPRPDQIVKF